jgi:threonine dehydrogenase-like Zn-dependent dehydrogenase
VEDVEPPVAAPGEVVVDVERVGLCGTDVELFTGEMAYLQQGHASYPLRLGHEWSGTVAGVGEGVDPGWIGRRTTGDTMLGCGHCARCTGGRAHLCEDRFELGVRGGRPGALAEQVAVPASSLHRLPDTVDPVAGALVDLGAGAIALLAAQFAAADGVEVHLMGRSERSLAFARGLGLGEVWTAGTLPSLPFDAVIDASNAPELPALALELVEPGGRVVYIGLAGTPSTIDTRTLALKDVSATGILGGSPGLAATIALYADGSVDPRPLVAATVGLDEVGRVLGGERPVEAGLGPKIHVDPRR